VLVTPPAPEQATLVWELLADPGGAARPVAVIVCPDRSIALDWATTAPPAQSVHAVSSLARTTRLLAGGGVQILAASLDDLTPLVASAAVKLAEVGTVVVAWPETPVAGPGREALDAVLAEAANAHRIILSWNPPALREFLDRHAFRAPVVGPVPLDDTARPLPPVASARYTIVAADDRLGAIRGALDVLDPKSAVIWTPQGAHADRLGAALGSGERAAGLSVGTDVSGTSCDLVVCARIPTRAQLAALAARGPVLMLLSAAQLGYARSLAAPLTPLRLPGASGRAADAVEALRRRVGARLEAGEVNAELLALEPLFERFDPAEVAAALLALHREQGAGSGERVAPVTGAAPVFVKLFVNVGKKDRAGAKDLVGALIKEVGLQKEDLGRIDVRETFSTVEVAAGVADDVPKKLAGVTIRGRRVQARTDRGKSI